MRTRERHVRLVSREDDWEAIQFLGNDLLNWLRKLMSRTGLEFDAP